MNLQIRNVSNIAIEKVIEYSLGIDDTDSNRQMCTTYLGAIICDILLKWGANFLDFPKLIRLNPNIPYKTRGNGAIAIHFEIDENREELLWEKLKLIIQEYSDVEDEKTHPGMVLVKGKIPQEFHDLYLKALYDVISLKTLKELINTVPNLRFFLLKKGRGLIGACCAIGANLLDDYTYELITYRIEENRGTLKRRINENSVIQADLKVPLSFNNVDYESNDIMITPHGPDPILCGIRGESPEAVIEMWSLLKVEEPVERIMIFRTNQHTNVHFPKKFRGHEIKPFLSVRTHGKVFSKPHYIDGGHIIFSLEIDKTIVDCAAYEPTKKFRNIIVNLVVDDEVTVFGGVRKPDRGERMTINLEEIQITHLEEQFNRKPPKCPHCNVTLKSAGKSAGFKCKKCSYRTLRKEYLIYQEPRKLRKGVRYVTPICAQRHLTKPVQRDVFLQFHLKDTISHANAFKNFIKIKESVK
ncbi:MAG: TiaS agmantine-binding domain-containing protein [Candidatus Hodarchaeales archaeon]